MPRTTVFLVTSGYYSDYSVVGVFSTLELALAYMGDGGNDIRVEPMVLDDPDASPQVRRPWHVQMYLDGSRDGNCVSPYPGDLSPNQSREASGAILSWSNRDREVLTVTCWADDQTRAVKIANEIRTAYNAGSLALPQSRYAAGVHGRWVTSKPMLKKAPNAR